MRFISQPIPRMMGSCFKAAIVGALASGVAGLALCQAAERPGAPRGERPIAAARELDAGAIGEELFQRQWVPGDRRSVAGDGLGPVYNANSCVACHRQGGVGGAGANEHNVDLLTVMKPAQRPPGSRAAHVGQLHPALADDPRAAGTVVVHRYGVDGAYASRRLELFGGKAPRKASDTERERLEAALDKRLAREGRAATYQTRGATLRRTQRQTPALFGAGLIDQITDEQIEAVAREQARHENGVRGVVAGAVERPNQYGDPRDPANAPRQVVGKFGWRGQTGSLRQFILNACANELGLEAPDRPQAIDPRHPVDVAPGLDVDEAACEALLDYVAALPAPRQRLSWEPLERQEMLDGAPLFAKIGCAECHRENLGPARGIYSDLLLHDMGADLADPVGARRFAAGGLADLALRFARPDAVAVGGDGAKLPPLPFPFPGGRPGVPASEGLADIDRSLEQFLAGGVRELIQFYSGSAAVDSQAQQAWRTPPLWGAADSAPYLHDGRAATLDEAIRLHGGEATASRRQFEALRAPERRKVLLFLQSLRAPRDVD